MGKVYEKADDNVMAVMRDALSRYHPELHALGPRVGITMITPNKDVENHPTAPTVAINGQSCAATIRKVEPKERVQNNLDLEIKVDSYHWEKLSPAERLALMDHELTHVEIVRGSDGQPKQHDDTRPKLRLRPDEIYFTGFASVIERHGSAALEYQSLKNINDKWGQQFFDWAEVKPSKRGAKHGLRAAV